MNDQDTVTFSHRNDRYVHLSRFLHMNDQHNTQIFTFLLLPHLLCSTLEEVESAPFLYADHKWIVSFRKSETHLGVFLELALTNSDRSTNRKHKNLSENSSSYVQWRTVTVDFQCTLKNPEHFSRNELFARRGCTFSATQAKHGRRRFIDLSQLSSKHFLFDDGKCVFEIELKNPDIFLHLWAYQCQDPASYFSRTAETTLCENRAVKLMRMDGSVIHFDRSLHFETESFEFSDSPWMVTVDMEPGHLETNESSTIVDPTDVTVAVEICLVRKTTRTRVHSGSTPRTHNKHCTNFCRLKCVATLPGDCVTGVMEFSIGSQGWPMQAYRTTFERPAYEVNSNDELSVGHISPVDSNPQGAKLKISGSPIALLLSTISSPFSVGLRILSTSYLTFLEVPISMTDESPRSTHLMDPFDWPWYIRTITTGRILRIKLQPIYYRASQHSNKRSIMPTSQETHACFLPGIACVLGVELRIDALTQNLHPPVCPLGMDLVELIRYHPYMGAYARVSSDPDRCTRSTEQRTHSRSSQEECEGPLEDTYDVVMDIAVEKVLDKSSGFVNPLNDTILVEIMWVYKHIVFLERTQTIDAINQRQYIQMRNALEQIKKERDELEKQVVIKEMGLVQVDAKACGPRSLLPKEALYNLKPYADLSVQSRSSRSAVSDNDISGSRQLQKLSTDSVDEYSENFGSRTSLPMSRKEPVGGRGPNSPRCDFHPKPRRATQLFRHSGQQSFDYAQNVQENISRTSNTACATPDYDHSGLPERRKQFYRSRTIWQTYDSYQGDQHGVMKTSLHTQSSSSWSTPGDSRGRQVAENGRLRVKPRNYPTRTGYVDHEQTDYLFGS
ncbi:hypothetical protein CSKR_111054 [Clonorchis sinensis]|uniref:MATH domain-containing protein n=1 Tax=Clonorchis sinensis TaxID=79923 RepID=A0A419QE27_CLOSI|nr:hypothetical protein CSKR_111054 [Clonorchis sinensis]